jgi:hypothetical protein
MARRRAIVLADPGALPCRLDQPPLFGLDQQLVPALPAEFFGFIYVLHCAHPP